MSSRGMSESLLDKLSLDVFHIQFCHGKLVIVHRYDEQVINIYTRSNLAPSTQLVKNAYVFRITDEI